MKETTDDISPDTIAPEEVSADTPKSDAPADDKAKAKKAHKRKQPAPDAESPAEAAEADATAEHDDDGLSLKEVIKEQAIEDEMPRSRTFSLRKVLGGDILNTAAIRRQIWLFVLIGVFMIIYVSNRYSCQQNILEIDRLQTKLQDAKYKALSSSSELTEKSRESNVLQALKNQKDSTLKMPSQAPFYIVVPQEETK